MGAPELFHAYIGTGQVVSTRENEIVGYQHTLEVARERDSAEAIAELEAIAPYPHPEQPEEFIRAPVDHVLPLASSPSDPDVGGLENRRVH